MIPLYLLASPWFAGSTPPDAADRVIGRLRAEGWRLSRGQGVTPMIVAAPCGGQTVIDVPVPTLDMRRGHHMYRVGLTACGACDHRLTPIN